MIKKMGRAACMAAAAACLAACGGGGGGSDNASTPPPANTTTPLQVSILPQQIATLGSPASGAVEAFASVSVTGSKDALYVAIGTTLHAVAIATVTGEYLDEMQIHVTFKDAGALPNGTYSDTVTFELCSDDQCARQIAGSPFSVPVSYTVSGSSATAMPTGLSAPTGFLAHDVVDAAMSRPLGLLVMASTQPTSALQVMDVATGVERTIPLSSPPISLTLSPDGRQAAVGQDLMVSLVDLTQAQASVREAAVASSVWDLVMPDDHNILTLPDTSGWGGIAAVDMDTGASQLGLAQVYSKTRARLHPDGDRMYLLDTLLSPEVLVRYAVSGAAISRTGSAPDYGTWPACGNFWFSDSGDRIFTACGHVFGSNADVAQDMLHEGQLPLSYASAWGGSVIAWLDDQSAKNEIALLDAGACASLGHGDCNTVLRLIDDRDDTLRTTYWMPPVYRDGSYRPQHGQYVFHAADGSLRVITRLAGVTDATHAWTLDQPRVDGVSILSAAPTLPRAHAMAASRRQ